jgi:hypothetical protein
MSDDQSKPRTEADSELERQIRAEREFTLSEAIGRLAGPGAMKGASPVTRKQQAVAEIQEYLNRHLTDGSGALTGVLLRQVRESERLLSALDQPLAALAGHLRQVLDSEYILNELVREADAEWGRVLGELPCFETDGRPPAANDPYTRESVRTALTKLAGGLTAGEA